MTDTPEPPQPPTARMVDISTHAARLDDPPVSFRQIEPAGRSPAPAPAFLFGPVEPAAARAMFARIETPQTGCYAIAHAAIAPTGIALRDGLAFHGAQLNLPRGHVATITSRLNGASLPIRFVPGPLAVLFGPAEEDYGQLLIDYLPRLWLLEQAGYKLATLQILIPANLPPRTEEILAHLGLQPGQIVRYAHWEEIIRTDLLLLPTTLRRHDRLSPAFAQATTFWTTRIRSSLDTPPPEPRHCIHLADPATTPPPGFQSADAAAMDLPTRIATFSTAAQIIGPCSAALHDTVFSPPGSWVCGLHPPSFLQTSLGAALGLKTGYVFGEDEADMHRALRTMGL